MQSAMQYNYQHPVYAKDPKDIPEWLKDGHRWLPPVDFNKLPVSRKAKHVDNHLSAQKHQLKVRMCCRKCEEKVVEEIWEVPGVFDVRASWIDKKVVVMAMPEPIVLDKDEVLRKARKIDSTAKFVALDPSERSKVEKSKKSEKISPDNSAIYASYPGFSLPPEYRRPRPPSPEPYSYEPPPQDGNMPFYFFLFIIMLVAMYIFRK